MERCLICNCETMLATSMNFNNYKCKNGCIEYIKDNRSHWETYIIHNKTFTLDVNFLGQEEYDKRLKEIKRLISYWKKDYRYLAKMLLND